MTLEPLIGSNWTPSQSQNTANFQLCSDYSVDNNFTLCSFTEFCVWKHLPLFRFTLAALELFLTSDSSCFQGSPDKHTVLPAQKPNSGQSRDKESEYELIICKVDINATPNKCKSAIAGDNVTGDLCFFVCILY